MTVLHSGGLGIVGALGKGEGNGKSIHNDGDHDDDDEEDHEEHKGNRCRQSNFAL